MELRVLQYFLAVAREQSISAAAESLHISQPALSTQLKAMEEELGKQLLIRGTKGSRKVVLTEEGMILRKRAEIEGIEVSDEMLELIAGRIESNIRELEGSLTRVNAYAKLNGCVIDEACIAHALHDIKVVRDPKRITPDLIIDCVSDYYKLAASALRGDSRKKEIAMARHVAVYLTREMTGLSLPRIGDAFGRDHSTIINSCEKVGKLLESNAATKAAVADLRKIIAER